MEEQTLAFRNSSPLQPSMSCDIIGGHETGFHTGGDSYGLNLESIFIPYEADELRLSIGVTKVLPLEVTINYNVDPEVEKYYKLSFDKPEQEGKAQQCTDDQIEFGITISFEKIDGECNREENSGPVLGGIPHSDVDQKPRKER